MMFITARYCPVGIFDTSYAESGEDGSYLAPLNLAPATVMIWVWREGYETLHIPYYHISYNFVHCTLDVYLSRSAVSEFPNRNGDYLRLFPNPSSGLLRFSWSKGPQDLFIYDVLGRELKALPGELGYAELSLPPGVYFVKRGEQRIRAVVRSDRSSVY